jgi:hypothetical protein
MIDTPPARLTTAINAVDKSITEPARTLGATSMPSQRQTAFGVGNLAQPEKKRSEYSFVNLPFIRARRAAPSAITAENYLQARALMDEVYMHNAAATKREYISNSYDDAPRFTSQLDIMA